MMSPGTWSGSSQKFREWAETVTKLPEGCHATSVTARLRACPKMFRPIENVLTVSQVSVSKMVRVRGEMAARYVELGCHAVPKMFPSTWVRIAASLNSELRM